MKLTEEQLAEWEALVPKLNDDADDHMDVAHSVDMRPEHTANYRHAKNAHEAAYAIHSLIAELREAQRLRTEASMNKLQRSAYTLAGACKGNPVNTTLVVMLFFIGFSVVEAAIEKLMFGDRFENFLDPIFALSFMGYAAYAVYWCAVFNSRQHQAESGKDGA